MMKPAYWEKQENNSIHCLLCPNDCVIKPGHVGNCKVRKNDQGALSLPYYGEISSLALDPIEKKPLYHFKPGSRILSIGFVGCSFKCPFCQNHSISQSTHVPTNHHSPADIVAIAQEHNSSGIAYTYSEPTIHFEFIRETAELAHIAGLYNVIVSNGYLNHEPAEELLDLVDAANIDLKCFNEDFYKREIKGSLRPVLAFIKTAASKCALEVTTLIIPGKNDSTLELESIARFLGDIDTDIPLHLSRYYPTYKYSIPSTPVQTMEKLAAAAGKYLTYIYLGNVGVRETNTSCPECGNLLIRRAGYSTHIVGLDGNVCSECSAQTPVVLS